MDRLPVADVVRTGRAKQTKPNQTNPAINQIVGVILPELENTPDCKGPVEAFPTLTLQSLPNYFTATVTVISEELDCICEYDFVKKCTNVEKAFDAISEVCNLMEACTALVKNNPEFVRRAILVAEMKLGFKFVESFVKKVLPMCEKHFNNYRRKIVAIIKTFQKLTRTMQSLIAYGKRERDSLILKETPKLKKILELFIYKVRAMMKRENCLEAVWVGNLKPKNIDGTECVDFDDEESDVEEEVEVEVANNDDEAEAYDSDEISFTNDASVED